MQVLYFLEKKIRNFTYLLTFDISQISQINHQKVVNFH